MFKVKHDESVQLHQWSNKRRPVEGIRKDDTTLRIGVSQQIRDVISRIHVQDEQANALVLRRNFPFRSRLYFGRFPVLHQT